MRLVNAEYNISLEFEENMATLLIIEEKTLRLKFVSDIYRQCSGEEGEFILSEDMKILKMNKIADILINPFSFDCNSRKILTKLYQEIEDSGNANFYEEKEKINGEILSLLDNIMLNVPYSITANLELNLIDMCKLYNVQLDSIGESLLERLMEYIRVMSQLCSLKLFVLLNFTSYLSEKDMKDLFEFMQNQKVYLLLIEYAMPADITDKNGCIIDADGCIINL